jgi:hypothetical protein
MGVGLRATSKGMEMPPNPKESQAARLTATLDVQGRSQPRP